MAKNSVTDYDTNPLNNTDIAGIGILGSSAVSNFDDAFRTLMAQLKAEQTARKLEVSSKPQADSISTVGFIVGNKTLPYMRHTDTEVVELATQTDINALYAAKQNALSNETSIELGLGVAGDHASFFDRHTSAAVLDYNARDIREAGVNGAWSFIQTGTGAIGFYGGSNFTYNNNAVITAATIGVQAVANADNANRLAGLAASYSAAGDSIAARDSAGDLTVRLLHTNWGDDGSIPNYFLGQNAVGTGVDNVARPANMNSARTALGVITEAARVNIMASPGSVGSYVVARFFLGPDSAVQIGTQTAGANVRNPNTGGSLGYGGTWVSCGSSLGIAHTAANPVYVSHFFRIL